ncbi:MAG: hypothetical protein KAQ69_06945 [Spirochaetales bacterium]|nr:hypothetical protein [Spirochaetales bacterium]
MKKTVLLLLYCIVMISTQVPLFSEPLTVLGIQYKLEIDNYQDIGTFSDSLHELFEEYLPQERPLLVVFPEYTSVPLSLIPESGKFGEYDSFHSAFQKIYSTLDPDLNSLFSRRASYVEKMMDQVWGSLALSYGVYLGAGTVFTLDKTGGLKNRMYIYGPDGNRIYQQDKVFLTPFEESVLNLQSGKIRDAPGFELGGKKIVFTICRDSFFEQWNDIHGESTLWIDIKANGVSFDAEQREIFHNALPERIRQTGVPYGMTLCLTGSFFDLFWEGESSLIGKTDNDVLLLQRTDNWIDNGVIRLNLD